MKKLLSECLVTADELEAFAIQNRMAEDLLSEVLRLLVLNSIDSARVLDFQTGRAIYSPGWDGRVDCTGGKLYVPDGQSGWELTVRQDHREKAEESFLARVASTGISEQKETTYIHWTLRKWSSRGTWAKTRAATKIWRDVRAYDASDLVTWLLEHPAIHFWLSRRVGKIPEGILDPWLTWVEFSESPARPLPRSTVLFGYENQRSDFINRIGSGNPVTTVQWEHPKLSAMFIAAVLSDDTAPEVEKLATRCLFVKTPSAYEDLVLHHKNLIFVLMFEPENLGLAKRNGHQVVLLSGRDAVQSGDIILGGRTQSKLYEAIGNFEPDETLRRQLAAKAAAKFWSFHRSLTPSIVRKPSWVRPENLAFLLANQWDTRYEGDREILAALAGEKSCDVESRAVQLSRQQDPLIRQNGTKQGLIDADEAWGFLAGLLADEHLDAFEKAITTVFAEIDPQYLELDAQKASLIRMFEDRQGGLRYSNRLRAGLATTLSFLGACDPDMNERGRRTAHSCASTCVARIYEASQVWQAFCTIAPSFTSFAEADPEIFLRLLESDLKNDSEKIVTLFRDDKDIFTGGHSPHTHLLWALELIAWSPQYLVRAALALVRLAAIDPGGRMANRPPSSLANIFLVWHPCTLADWPQRFAALKRVVEIGGSRGWDLIHTLLPTMHDIAMPTHGARYRPWGSLWRQPLSHRDIYLAYEEIVELAVTSAGLEGSRWRQLIRVAPRLSLQSFVAITDGLERVAVQEHLTDRLDVFEALRKTIAQHQHHPEEEWAMKSDRLAKYLNLIDLVKPSSPADLWTWVFGHHAIFELGPGDDYDAKNREVEALKTRAVAEVLDATELEGVLQFALRCENPNMVGDAFARVQLTDSVESIVARAHQLGNKGRSFAWGFLWALGEQNGSQVIFDLIHSPWGNEQSPDIRSVMLRAMRVTATTISEVDAIDLATQEAFWTGFRFLSVRETSTFCSVLDRLRRFGAWATALNTTAMAVRDGECECRPIVVLGLLEQALKDPKFGSQISGDVGHDISELLDFLDGAEGLDEVRIAQLEFHFAALLSFTRRPRVLNRIIGRDPASFVALIRAVFNPRGAPEDFLEDPPNQGAATLAYEVLSQLESIPGTQPDGTISDEALLAWANESQRLAKQIYRSEIFESQFGEWLSNSPDGTDGFFPHEAVRTIIEAWESNVLENGFACGVHNGRGVYSKGFDEGGAQERALAAKYQTSADALSRQWARTSGVLRSISDGYTDEAKREDRRIGLE